MAKIYCRKASFQYIPFTRQYVVPFRNQKHLLKRTFSRTNCSVQNLKFKSFKKSIYFSLGGARIVLSLAEGEIEQAGHGQTN